MKAVIFRHNIGNIGNFAPILDRLGVETQIVEAWRDGVPEEFDALAPDLVIVMGGAPAAFQSHLYPFLERELEIIKARLDADRPTLGICLGAQLMAKALGSGGYRGQHGPEIGWYDLTLTPAGEGHAVRHLGKAVTKIAESHYETFDLPDGAVLLASSDKYPNQIFSWRDHCLAIQAHPEANAEGCKQWEVSYAGALEREKIDVEEWRAETARCLPVMMRQTETFLGEWIGGLSLA